MDLLDNSVGVHSLIQHFDSLDSEKSLAKARDLGVDHGDLYSVGKILRYKADKIIGSAKL